MRCHQAHGPGRFRLRLRGRPHPPHELCVAQRIRDVAPPGASIYGRGGGHACRARSHQSVAVRAAGPVPPRQESARRVLEGVQPAVHRGPGRAGGRLPQDTQRREEFLRAIRVGLYIVIM